MLLTPLLLKIVSLPCQCSMMMDSDGSGSHQSVQDSFNQSKGPTESINDRGGGQREK